MTMAPTARCQLLCCAILQEDLLGRFEPLDSDVVDWLWQSQPMSHLCNCHQAMLLLHCEPLDSTACHHVCAAAMSDADIFASQTRL